MKKARNIVASAKGLSKSFGGLNALSDIDFDIERGDIFGIIGPNGAGKTTLFNILTGIYKPDSGYFEIGGKNLTRSKPHDIVKSGLARTFQNIRLFGGMTCLDNVKVGCHVRGKIGVLGAIFRHQKAIDEEKAIENKAKKLIEYVGLNTDLSRIASNLSYGDQRRLEIARALATGPLIIALDEPAAGMNPTETGELRDLLVKMKSDGITILLIEHDVKLVMGLCDRVAVLDYGRKIAEGVPEAVRVDPLVITAYLGGDLP